MALAPSIVEQIRDEIGPDEDVTDEAQVPPAPLSDLETIYIDVDRGNFSVLNTAYIVWKRRLAAFQLSAFDATAGGSLMARTGRARFLQRRVRELSLLVDFTLKATNDPVLSNYQANEPASSEFS